MTAKLKRLPRARRPHVHMDPALWALLTDQPMPSDSGFTEITYRLSADCTASRDVWAKHKEAVLAYWLEHHPGTRPPFWWLFDAPEMRRRVAGAGVPLHDTDTAFQNAPAFHLGVPREWVTPFWRRFLKLNAPMIDADNPPMYESQAAYLKRLALLTSAERKALSPAAYEPEDIFAIGVLTLEDLEDE